MTYYSALSDNASLFANESSLKYRTRGKYRNSPAGAGMGAARSRSKSFHFMVLFVFIILSSFLFGMMVDAYASGNSLDTSLTNVHEPAVVFAKQGDSLWSIARSHAQDGTDLRSYIEAMKKLNGIKNGYIMEGQKIVLPD
ncbi:LysM peptidoglycan-binding domain-containing protein [Ferviditalea candida]|uniref:LysM peptidoglycan-binding domain-containing protein n=1 Tax=Ferviditalea candida TaxID=3108399 RepID=A0ABU5ZJM9_9BACL|nr:LysM peptidoglycan-binding domain-containing protein [Paenibacillaceae bacterium T2]